jgi:hypothetical protein
LNDAAFQTERHINVSATFHFRFIEARLANSRSQIV